MIRQVDCKCDNQKIYAVIYAPDNLKRVPTVIMAHGLSMTHQWFENYALELLKYDVASVLFDFRGGSKYSKSDGDVADSTVLTELKDLESIVKEVKELSFVDTNNIFLIGHSQGGFVSALYSSKHPDDVKSLFLLAPAFIIPNDMNKQELPLDDSLIYHTAGYFGKRYILDARKVKVYEDFINYKKEVYIFHGENDSLVPITYSENAIKEYANAHLIRIPDENHLFTNKGHEDIIKKVLEVIGSNYDD